MHTQIHIHLMPSLYRLIFLIGSSCSHVHSLIFISTCISAAVFARTRSTTRRHNTHTLSIFSAPTQIPPSHVEFIAPEGKKVDSQQIEVTGKGKEETPVMEISVVEDDIDEQVGEMVSFSLGLGMIDKIRGN